MVTTQNETDQVGLSFPVLKYYGGYFGSKDEMDCLWGDILACLFTPVGTRPMNRLYGTRLQELLAEHPNSGDPIVKYVIEDTIREHVPRAVVYEVRVVALDDAVQVFIRFGHAGGAVTQMRGIDTNLRGQIRALGAEA